eukprot:CAMPEP_0198226502 /NCGR_PEP_ID=MMETSP1445-20131203/105515_1 /TAXON_ID=36898 /ORGANISM="Pyramimonas sp., Strain CCMP2087" /LENGTH=47 /DNA_ID= /DNA_START= /DNA_END= /DNA_ORIENTATION=
MMLSSDPFIPQGAPLSTSTLALTESVAPPPVPRVDTTQVAFCRKLMM